jgi:hypothetical protein
MMLPKCPTDKIYGSAKAYHRGGEPDATSNSEAEFTDESVAKKQDSALEEFVLDPQFPINKKFGIAEACHRVVEKPKIEELDLDPQESSIEPLIPDSRLAKVFCCTPRTLARWRLIDPDYNRVLAPFKINGRWFNLRRGVATYKKILRRRTRAPPAE